MHNLYAIFAKFLDICKMFSADFVNEKGNILRREIISKFSDLEVISLSLVAESIGIDSESFLFSKLNEYKDDFYYVLGDNAFISRDSRFFGYISEKNIIGRMKRVLFSVREPYRIFKGLK